MDWFTITLATTLAMATPGPEIRPAPMPAPGAAAPAGPVFEPKNRAVTNWRTQALDNLELSGTVKALLQTGADPSQVTRCVRLNNYWCIKRAGWAGEIASDGEGHVAFASAAEGADVAALLLRRYYLDYGRHSAQAIISHWAPASCGGPMRIVARRATRIVRTLRASGPPNRPDSLSTHGIGNTLRARFLAARGRGRRARIRVSRVPDTLIKVVASPGPTIAVGMGERPVALPPLLSASALRALDAPLGPAGTGSGLPLRSCPGDLARIHAYALKTAAGVAPTIEADLKLFLPDGTPTANLNRVMHNMSAVEVGPLGATQGLVDAAVERAAERVAKTAAAGRPIIEPPR